MRNKRAHPSSTDDLPVKLMDFGLAKSLGRKTICATPQYFTPNVLMYPLDGAIREGVR